MAKPVLRNEDIAPELAIRKYLRRTDEQPRYKTGTEGFVVEDNDLVIRLFGPEFGTDDIGKLMMLDEKYPGHDLGPAQIRTFGLQDWGLRRGLNERYMGFYVINIEWGNDGFPVKGSVRVNDIEITDSMDLKRFFYGDLVLPSYDFVKKGFRPPCK